MSGAGGQVDMGVGEGVGCPQGEMEVTPALFSCSLT